MRSHYFFQCQQSRSEVKLSSSVDIFVIDIDVEICLNKHRWHFVILQLRKYLITMVTEFTPTSPLRHSKHQSLSLVHLDNMQADREVHQVIRLHRLPHSRWRERCRARHCPIDFSDKAWRHFRTHREAFQQP